MAWKNNLVVIQYTYLNLYLTAQHHEWDRYPHLSLEEIQRKSALEELYFKEEKTRQMKAEASKAEVQLRIYSLKAEALARERNYGPPYN